MKFDISTYVGCMVMLAIAIVAVNVIEEMISNIIAPGCGLLSLIPIWAQIGIIVLFPLYAAVSTKRMAS